MRAVTYFALLMTLSACALTRSKVGPQVMASYPYASDVTIPALAGTSTITRRIIREVAHAVRKATRGRIRTDADRRATIIDALGTMLPGAAPQIR